MFLDRPCQAASDRFARDFENQDDATEGARATRTDPDAFFGPMVFYAALTGRGDVAILDYEPDKEYFDLIADDPED